MKQSDTVTRRGHSGRQSTRPRRATFDRLTAREVVLVNPAAPDRQVHMGWDDTEPFIAFTQGGRLQLSMALGDDGPWMDFSNAAGTSRLAVGVDAASGRATLVLTEEDGQEVHVDLLGFAKVVREAIGTQ